MTTSIAAPTIDFVLFYVSDMQTSLEYFTEKLGFGYLPEQSSPTFCTLSSGEGSIGFGLLLVEPETPPAGTVEVYFKTPDLDQLRSAITGRGVEATPIVHRPFGSIFTVQSPDKQLLTMMVDPA